MSSSTRALSDAERHRIDSTLRGLSSGAPGPQAESHLKVLLHFIEGDPWVCNAVVKQTSAVNQLFQVLEGNGPGMQCTSQAAATALEILGILAMRTQSSRVAAPFCRLEGMRVLVRQLNFCDPVTDVALATFLEQLFSGSESEPTRAVAATVGLIQKIVDRMSSSSVEVAPPVSISAFARVFVVAAQWHVPRKQAEAHYSIDAFFRILDNHIPALVAEREEHFATRAEHQQGEEVEHQQQQQQQQQQEQFSVAAGSSPSAAYLVSSLSNDEEAPVAHCFSHVLRCLVVLVSNNQDNATSACADRNLAIVARLVSIVAKDTNPSRLIATLLWFVYSVAEISPRLEEAIRNSLSYGYQIGCTAEVNNNNNNNTNTSISGRDSPSTLVGGGQNNNNNSRPPSGNINSGRLSSRSMNNNTNTRSYYILGESNAWSASLAPFRKIAASLPTHLETIRREHLRPDVVAGALREICNSVFMSSSSSVCKSLSRFVIGSPFIIKCLLLPLANVDEELVIRACQLISFAVEGNPSSSARYFFFLGGVLILKDILDDYNPVVLYNALKLTQHLAQDGWVLRELAERGVISRILHMMIEEIQQQQNGRDGTTEFSSLTTSRSHQAECVANSAMTNEPMLTAFQSSPVCSPTTATSTSGRATSAGVVVAGQQQQQPESLTSALLQTSSVIFKSHHVTADICTVLFHQGKTFSGYLWGPIESWIESACSILVKRGNNNNNNNTTNDFASITTLPETILLPAVLDTASSLMRSVLFTYHPGNNNSSDSNASQQQQPPIKMSSTKAEALFSMDIKIKNISEAASIISNFLRSVFTMTNTTTTPLFPVDSPQILSSLYFLASCCAVDPSQEGRVQMQLMKKEKTIETIAAFIAGPPGPGRVAAWTLLAALSSRIPEAQQLLAENSLIVSAMENVIRGGSSSSNSHHHQRSLSSTANNSNNSNNDLLEQVTPLPRASGRPRSASSPFNQSMSLLQRVLECADHIFLAKSKEYGYQFALDVGRILAHSNSSMDVRSAALDVLQVMFVINNSSSSSPETEAEADLNSGIPSIVPHIVQLLLLCEETEDTEAVTMVANRAFKLLTSLPAQQTMSTLFKIARDALEMMNISISTLNLSPQRDSAGSGGEENDTLLQRQQQKNSFTTTNLLWKWSPLPVLHDADDAHDMMVGLLPLINGLLHQETSFCEVLYTNPNAWSFFFVLADAQDLQLGLRVLALISFGNMVSRVRNPQKVSIFFDSSKNHDLQGQFVRALSGLLSMRSALDGIANHNNSSNIGILLEARQASIRGTSTSLQQQQQQQYLPDEALETLFFVLDRISMFGKKLQAPSFFVTPNNNHHFILLDSLFCACFVVSNENISQFARSLLYFVFQSEGTSSQLSPEQLSRLKVTLSAIVQEMNNEPGGASTTDSRRQAESILKTLK